jgi:diguanylate cyclase (GGDEF)-like protein/PAS domain S-box-containing protein
MDKNNFKKPRYIIIYGVIILFIINLFFLYSYNVIKDEKIQNKKKEYVLYIESFENKLDFYINNLFKEMEEIEIEELLFKKGNINDTSIFLLIDNHGLVLSSNNASYLNKNYSNYSFYKNTLKNRKDVSRYSQFVDDDSFILISVLKEYKEESFVVSIMIKEDFLLDMFSNQDELVLITEDGKYLVRPDYLSEFVKNIDLHDKFYKKVIDGEGYVFEEFKKAKYDKMIGLGKKIRFENYSINVIYQNYEEVILESEHNHLEVLILSLLVINFLLIILISIIFKNTKNALIVREKLKKEYIFSKTILDTIESIVLITDKKNNIKSVNKAFEKIVGYMSEEVYGKNISRFLYNINSRKVYSDSEKLIEVSWITKDKKELHTTLNKSYLYDSNGEVNNVIYSGLDTTKQKKYEKILKEKATKDQMTGLFNRNTGINYLKMLINEKSDDNILSIAYIDLDNLKQINDKYGHNVGDLYIISISNILKTSIRENDYAVRMGGDEFMLILPLCGPEDAEKVVFKNIHDKISIKNEELLSENKPKISISYGISEYSKELYDNIDSFISSADEKMYKNKSKKK